MQIRVLYLSSSNKHAGNPGWKLWGFVAYKHYIKHERVARKHKKYRKRWADMKVCFEI
jgi:hypothetical protein